MGAMSGLGHRMIQVMQLDDRAAATTLDALCQRASSNTQPVSDHKAKAEPNETASLPLPRQIAAGAEATDDDEICAICLEPKGSSQALSRITYCGHTLRNVCWQRLEKSNKASSMDSVCPMCHGFAHTVDLLEAGTQISANGPSSTTAATFLSYKQKY